MISASLHAELLGDDLLDSCFDVVHRLLLDSDVLGLPIRGWRFYQPHAPPRPGPAVEFRSGHVHAAVDVQRRAGDVAGRRARRGRRPPRRCPRRGPGGRAGSAPSSALRLRLGQRARHVGVDEARRDAVDRDVAAAELARERLASCRRRRPWPRRSWPGRGCRSAPTTEVMLMMRPAARLHHAAHHRARQAEHRLEVGVEHRVPVLVLHAQRQVVARDAGVVDQDRDRAVAPSRSRRSQRRRPRRRCTSSTMPRPVMLAAPGTR